jgi:hypothetical protein
MGGGLLQLVAMGAQDAYLSGNPQITFWKGMFKRHTNFAMEPFRINFTGQPNWGTKQSATINRNADLLYSTYLEVQLPSYNSSSRKDACYNNDQFHLGYNLLKYAELEIGGQLIDRQYGEWMFLWDTLCGSTEKSLNGQQMVGVGGRKSVLAAAGASPIGTNSVTSGTAGNLIDVNGQTGATASMGQVFIPAENAGCKVGSSGGTSQPGHPTIVYVPLNFFYCRNPGAALPLIALQYHEVKINILWNDNQLISGDYNHVPVPAQPSQAAIYVDYIYLDVEERRRMAQESHEYLIEQVQYNEDKGLSSYQNRIDLTFNHPVKELIWVVQPTCYRSCKIKIPGESGGPAADDNSARSTLLNRNRLTPFTYDQTAVFKQHLQINGQDRLDARYGDYYNKVQPYQHHTGITQTEYIKYTTDNLNAGPGTVALLNQPGVYCYSFALKPEEHQPSGTCNFSRIDTATLVLQMSGDVVVNAQTDATWDVRVYALNYNILRIMSGMAGLAYSN